MNQIKAYWDSRSQRDQIVLLFFGVFIGIFVLWWLVLQPMAKSVDQQRISTRNSSESLVRVRAMAMELQQLQKSGGNQNNQSSGPLSGVVDRSLQARGLRMSNFQPLKNGNEARLRLEEAEYNQVIQWLNDLESQHQIRAQELTITPSRNVGRVTVSVRLAG